MIRRLLLLAVSTGIALAGAEIVVRFAWDKPSDVMAIGYTGIHQPDVELGWRPRPNFSTVHRLSKRHAVTVTTNARGWRDRDHDASPTSGITRILILGDSFAFGWGVADREHFGARLEATAPEDVETVTLAAAGWGLPQYLAILKREGLSYHPDRVLVTLFQNDITDEGVPPPGHPSMNRPLAQTAPPSPTVSLALWDLLRGIVKGSRPIGQSGIRAGLWPASDVLDDTIRPAMKQPTPDVERDWAATFAHLGRLHALTQAVGVPLTVATIPAKAALTPGLVPAMLARSSYAPADFDLALPYRRIDEWCATKGLRCLNGFDALRSAPGPLYLATDPHFNAAGHEAFARALADIID